MIGRIVFTLLFANIYYAIMDFISLWLAVFLAASFLKIRYNSLTRALMVPLSVMVIAFVVNAIGFGSGFIGAIIPIAALILMIKYFYILDWGRSFSLWLVSLVIFFVLAALVAPLILAFLLGVGGL